MGPSRAINTAPNASPPQVRDTSAGSSFRKATLAVKIGPFKQQMINRRPWGTVCKILKGSIDVVIGIG